MRASLGFVAERVFRPDFGNCLRLADGFAELLVAVDYGPRVMSYSLVGGPNPFFFNDDGENVKKGEAFDAFFHPGAYWNIRGGNRLWVSPHSFPGAFYPDNDPLEFQLLPDGAIFLPRPQQANELQTRVEIRLDRGKVSMGYSVTNLGGEAKRMGAWAVTAMAPGGLEIIPQPKAAAGVLPNRRIALWDYTAMRDERIFWGNEYIAVKQDPSEEKPLKLGINNIEGWACYLKAGECFLLRHPHLEGGEYPDFGVSYETYAHDRMLEMESLSPLALLAPGEAVEHRESWELFPAAGLEEWRDEKALADFVAENIAGRLEIDPPGWDRNRGEKAAASGRAKHV